MVAESRKDCKFTQDSSSRSRDRWINQKSFIDSKVSVFLNKRRVLGFHHWIDDGIFQQAMNAE